MEERHPWAIPVCICSALLFATPAASPIPKDCAPPLCTPPSTNRMQPPLPTGEWVFESALDRQSFDCEQLWRFGDSSTDAVVGDLPFPAAIPPHWDDVPAAMKRDFIMAGRATVLSSPTHYYDEAESSASHFWSREEIDRLVDETRAAALAGTFLVEGVRGSYSAVQRRPALVAIFSKAALGDITGYHFLVIGSERPWLETALLAAGAAFVTTIEYNPQVQFQHPRLEVISWDVARARYRADHFGPFDGVASFSSVEHSGLGRYGDPLGPWEDIISIARCWCVAKPGARMLLSVPTSVTGDDRLYWNAHRLYGRIRWPMLAAGWRIRWRMGSSVYTGEGPEPAGGFTVPWGQVDVGDAYLEIPHVFEKPRGARGSGCEERSGRRVRSFLAPSSARV